MSLYSNGTNKADKAYIDSQIANIDLSTKADLAGNTGQTFRVANAVLDTEAINKGQLTSLLPKTSAPVVTIVTSVNEQSYTSGSYTSSNGSITTLTALKGSIIDHDEVNKVFTFIAHDITTAADETDTITAKSTKAGELGSLDNTTNIAVVYVPLFADLAISNSSFQTNEASNDGFTY